MSIFRLKHYREAKEQIENGLLKKIADDLIIRYAGELAKENLKSNKALRLQASISVAEDVIRQISKVAKGSELTQEEIKNLKMSK